MSDFNVGHDVVAVGFFCFPPRDQFLPEYQRVLNSFTIYFNPDLVASTIAVGDKRVPAGAIFFLIVVENKS